MDGLDGTPPMREHTVQDGQPPLSRSRSRTLLPQSNTTAPGYFTTAPGYCHKCDHSQLTTIDTLSSHGLGLPVTF